MTQRVSSHGRSTDAALEELQRRDLAKYWPVLSDIAAEFRRTKPRGLYSGVSGPAFEVLRDMHQGQLWTTNVIVVDEAGTLSVHILTAVVFCYWFFNAWLRTPLYRRGRIPCIVCVGSPTQTDAFQSSFSHETQVNKIRECDNILTFLVGNPRAATYVDVARNWALFINNKRCTEHSTGQVNMVTPPPSPPVPRAARPCPAVLSVAWRVVRKVLTSAWERKSRVQPTYCVGSIMAALGTTKRST